MPHTLGGVQPGGERLAVTVVLDRAVEGVGVRVEPSADRPERLVGAEPRLGGEDLRDPPVQPVEHDPRPGQGVTLVPRHSGGPELGERDDHQIQPGRAVAGEATEVRRRAVREDDVQIVVGVLGGHAVVGPRALEDEADDGGVGSGECDERVVGGGLLRGHA
ncbi:hypothetical protein ADK36_23585 [Streptomyces viridochromogenes]|nr:hypothetical protein ADK36_23585 [Streptomyces viridochromogenes]